MDGSQNDLLNKKWKKFTRRSRLFSLVPFFDFAFAAGSMALGNPHEYSDFDVIVGVKKGRIFTARFFAVVLFDLFGWRRKKAHDKNTDPKSVSDKICLSHFVTEDSYRLAEPHNEYWHRLYQSLVPLTGSTEKIRFFFDANDWLHPRRAWESDERFFKMRRSFFRVLTEFLLRGRLGDLAENALRNIQIRRIESHPIDDHPKSSVIYGDKELRFHPHTSRRKHNF
ncbi:MAG: hypothetical protein A3B23_03245 [Candidatus Colwellbacteria bacterium RIFCSPLOWO2_01_FULL_48_10]|nr:MAG: hypothetical protein A3B23_03245 [Candidatus Colwellbacteria bacterium RIFCSPLOWO2_01_FULL_48_10]